VRTLRHKGRTVRREEGFLEDIAGAVIGRTRIGETRGSRELPLAEPDGPADLEGESGGLSAVPEADDGGEDPVLSEAGGRSVYAIGDRRFIGQRKTT